MAGESVISKSRVLIARERCQFPAPWRKCDHFPGLLSTRYNPLRLEKLKMPSILGHEQGKRKCDHGGAIYEVMLSRYTGRHSTSHRCEVCGNLMESQSIFVPNNFKLIDRPEAPKSRRPG